MGHHHTFVVRTQEEHDYRQHQKREGMKRGFPILLKGIGIIILISIISMILFGFPLGAIIMVLSFMIGLPVTLWKVWKVA